ncbi:hypothetical protein TNCV_1960821 [Trichonephila clavipes]|nr:hypothetical protein TNCV_1960821 [Trichonephila clavipes]
MPSSCDRPIHVLFNTNPLGKYWVFKKYYTIKLPPEEEDVTMQIKTCIESLDFQEKDGKTGTEREIWREGRRFYRAEMSRDRIRSPDEKRDNEALENWKQGLRERRRCSSDKGLK